MNDQTREYFNFGIANDVRGAKRNYQITKLAPWKGPPPLWTLPADGFSYLVQPIYELNLQFDQSNTVLIRYLAEANGAWYEVEPCPNEKGIAFIRERIARGNQQRKRAAELAAKLKDPYGWRADNDSETASSHRRRQEISGSDRG